MNTDILGISAALMSAASWALGAIMFSKIGESVSPVAMTFAKGVIGIVLLGIVYIYEGVAPVSSEVMIILLISGLVGISLGDTLFFMSLRDLGPKTQIIMFMFGQIVTAVLGIIIFKEYPTTLQYFGILLTLIGVSIVLWVKIKSSSSEIKTNIRGIAYGMLSMIMFSSSILFVKSTMSEVSTIGATFYRITASTVGVLLFGLFGGKVKGWVAPFKGDIKMVLYFVMSVAIVMFGGFWLSLVSIKYINIGVASALNATEPLFVLPLSYIIMKEKVAMSEIMGALFTMSGIIIIAL